jgi:alpha-glucosidase
MPLPVHPAYTQANVATLSRDERSLLTLYRRLIQLRRSKPALSIGAKCLIEAPDGVLAYERSHNRQRLLVALNFTSDSKALVVRETSGTIALSSGLDREGEPLGSTLLLRADEAVVVEYQT